MKCVLAEVSKRTISFHYYDGEKENRSFELDSGPIPLAIACRNGEFIIGHPAKQAFDDKQADAFDNLFTVMGLDVQCNGVPARSFIPKVIQIGVEELCRQRFYGDLGNLLREITLVLFFCNDVPNNTIRPITNEVEDLSFVKVVSYDFSAESVKFFSSSKQNDWSGEKNAMVVMSDNEDLSVKCYSLSDYKLIFEHCYEGQGSDPRLDWAAKKLWNENLKAKVYLDDKIALPIIKKAIESLLISKELELKSVRLPRYGEMDVFLSRGTYYSYSPVGGNQFATIANDVVRKMALNNTTTGIILQGYAADNKFFRESFIDKFDPISDENEAARKEIRDKVLREMLGLKESIEIDSESFDCPCSGGTFKIGVKCSPAGVLYKASNSDNWIDLMIGNNSIGIDVKKNESLEKRIGEIVVTSAYGNINKVLKVVQFGEAIPSGLAPIGTDDDGKRKFNMSYTISNEKKKHLLTVEAEILDNKALPFDCVFTIASRRLLKLKREESLCEECGRSSGTVLKFGPYSLPIEEVGPSRELYAQIWPADKNKSVNLFKNSTLKIVL